MGTLLSKNKEAVVQQQQPAAAPSAECADNTKSTTKEPPATEARVIVDIDNSNYRYQQLWINVNSVCHKCRSSRTTTTIIIIIATPRNGRVLCSPSVSLFVRLSVASSDLARRSGISRRSSYGGVTMQHATSIDRVGARGLQWLQRAAWGWGRREYRGI